MNKKKLLLLPLLATIGLSLVSCGGGQETGESFNPFEENKFDIRFAYSVNPDAEGNIADVTAKDPLYYDNTITVNSYIYTGEEDIPGYVENNGTKVIVDTYIRSDISEYDEGSLGYPIVAINEQCFYRNTNVTEVVLPETLTSIGSSAFRRASNLTTLNLEDLTNLNFIGDRALEDVPWYENYYETHTDGPIIFGNVLFGIKGQLSGTYTVPSNIKSIAADCFKDQKSLTNIVLPEGLENIGDSAFEGCSSLTSISIPDSVTSIGEDVLLGCTSLTSADLGTAAIAGDVFDDVSNITNLRYSGNVTLAELCGGEDKISGITHITISGEEGCENLFAGATNLEEVTFNQIKTLAKGSFTGCTSLRTLNGIETLEFLADTSISESAYWASLSDGPVYIGKNFVGFKGQPSEITLTEGTTGVSANAFANLGLNIGVDSSLKYIGENAFEGLTSITKLDLPNCVFVGANALKDCVNLTEIHVGDNCVIEKNAFLNDTKVTDLALPYGEKLDKLFGASLKDTLVKYTFLKGAMLVADGMFEDYAKLTEVTFSSTVESIGAKSFSGCASLVEVDFPVNITSIGNFAFQNCSNLTKVHFHTELIDPDENFYKFKGVKTILNFVFLNCKKLSTSTVDDHEAEAGTFILPESLTSINNCLFMGTSVNHIVIRMPDYYYHGVITETDVKDDQNFVTFGTDWNSDTLHNPGMDEHGNPYQIPYNVEKFNLDDYLGK